eukprot:1067635-Rhodomonas_salina.1
MVAMRWNGWDWDPVIVLDQGSEAYYDNGGVWEDVPELQRQWMRQLGSNTNCGAWAGNQGLQQLWMHWPWLHRNANGDDTPHPYDFGFGYVQPDQYDDADDMEAGSRYFATEQDKL